MRKWLIRIVAVLIPLILCGLLFPSTDVRGSIYLATLFNVREIRTPPADLLTAKAHWRTNPIEHYRLTVQYSRSIYPIVSCSQEFEVQNEQVIQVGVDWCSNTTYIQRFAPLARTITELFDQFEKDKTTISFQEQDRPSCPYFLDVTVAYASSGYPSSAHYGWAEASPWTLGPQTYKAIYGERTPIHSCLNQIDVSMDMTITVQTLP